MLAYSGKGGFMLKPVDLTLLIEAMKAMLETSICKTVVFRLDLFPLLPSVMADAGQMQQVVLNLVINASEAIGEETGGVSLRTGVLECDDVYLGNSRLEEKPPPGRFAFIEVSDTGCGMDEETQRRLFDPFFTTKFPGRGLGMSALQGIVRGHNGAILVDSDVGKGTIIRVLFPAMPAEERPQKPSIEPASTPPEKAALPAFSGTALLVDDEVGLRNLCKTILEHFGFRVLTASDGEECVKVFSALADEITCVILDLTMPKMDGAAAFIELKRIRPDVPVILSSGYDKTEATRRFTGKGLAGFIQKPYEIKTLRSELERVLKSV
jgi:CheY-like chemotaxis protein